MEKEEEMKNRIKVSQTSETSEKIMGCFTKKLESFNEKHSKYLSKEDKRFGELYIIQFNGGYIEFNFLKPFTELDSEFQKEAELFFSLALKGCLDKYSE